MVIRQGVMCCPKCSLWKRWRLFSSDRLDRKCIKCGYRFRALIDRKAPGAFRPGRGMPRSFEGRELPSYMPRHAVRSMLRNLNKFEEEGRRDRNKRLGYDDATFVKAAKLKMPPKGGSGSAVGEMMANDPVNWILWGDQE